MIKGIDIGNSLVKDESGYSFPAKISHIENIMGSKYSCILNNETYYLGEGEFDTTYRKVKKENYIKMLFGILAVSRAPRELQIMLGLPISQYKEDKHKLQELIREHFIIQGSFNKIYREYIIQDVEVYPEGVASLPNNYEGILVDIGGRTTDVCMVTNVNSRLKIEKPYSMAEGTLKLYSDFINIINSKKGLDLSFDDADRILRNGLTIKGERQDINFAINVFKEYLEQLITKLNIQYSLDTNNITFTGGGSLLLSNPIKNRIPYATIMQDALFSNARGFYRKGCKLWQGNN